MWLGWQNACLAYTTAQAQSPVPRGLGMAAYTYDPGTLGLEWRTRHPELYLTTAVVHPDYMKVHVLIVCVVLSGHVTPTPDAPDFLNTIGYGFCHYMSPFLFFLEA